MIRKATPFELAYHPDGMKTESCYVLSEGLVSRPSGGEAWNVKFSTLEFAIKQAKETGRRKLLIKMCDSVSDWKNGIIE